MPDLAHPRAEPEREYYDDLLGYPIEPEEINDLKPETKTQSDTSEPTNQSQTTERFILGRLICLQEVTIWPAIQSRLAGIISRNNMAQEYTIKDVKKSGTWKNSYGEYQSYALAITGIGEPVKMDKIIPVNREPEVGDVLYGHLEEQRSTTDKRIYYKFRSEPKPEDDKRQASIQSQFAIKTAVEVWIAQGCEPTAYDNIETEAKHFYKMINKVKGE